MNTRRNAFRWLILGVASAAAAVHATEGEIVALGEQGWREQAPALSAMSGSTLRLSVLVPVSLDPGRISIELWQVTGATLIPLERNVAFADVMEAAGLNAQGLTVLRLTFPEVKRKTRVLVKFISSEDPRVDAGRAQVWVYPQVNWAPLARRFGDGAPRLILFGESAELRAFLRLIGIVFEDRGVEPPDAVGAGTLVLGVMSALEWRERKDQLRMGGGRVVVFVSDEPGLPGVYTNAGNWGAITQVTLRVLDGLGRDAQATDQFLQLIEQQLHSASAAIP